MVPVMAQPAKKPRKKKAAEPAPETYDDLPTWGEIGRGLLRIAGKGLMYGAVAFVVLVLVYAFINPITGDVHNIAPDDWIFGVQSRQGRQVPPAIIIWLALISVKWETVNSEPIHVG